VATLAFSFAGSFVLLKVTQAVVGLRVTREDEATGLDLSQHAEAGYAFSEGVGGLSPAGHAPTPSAAHASSLPVAQGDSA
jgi:ammonium transporter, Amt family